jgi:hypothetical protein
MTIQQRFDPSLTHGMGLARFGVGELFIPDSQWMRRFLMANRWLTLLTMPKARSPPKNIL